MKARIRKTGEIVDIICYGGIPNGRSNILDYVFYIDSQGVEHTEPNHLNYYWDFEPIETDTDEHWQDVRERAAIAAMQGLLSNSRKTGTDKEYAQAVIQYTDAFIEKAADYLSFHLDTSKIDVNYKFEFIEEFRKHMKGE